VDAPQIDLGRNFAGLQRVQKMFRARFQ
jgi:hypothetical protein